MSRNSWDYSRMDELATVSLRIRCPHCSNAVELTDTVSFVNVVCPSCSSQFSLLEQAEGASTSFETRAGTMGRKRIAHFDLLKQVGVGGFGSVWKAHDSRLDRAVALKMPRKGQLEPAEVEFFLREARASAQIRHPNIVSVHEVGRDGDQVYIVSDFVEGSSLKEWLSEHCVSSREAAELSVKIANALHEAHEAGVVHRDLKPGNIMMDSAAEPYLTDFGLAKRDSGEITITVDGRIIGTPAYMSPEQARGEAHDADRRSDIYSLGVLLFELITGELPFRGDSRMLIVQILQDEPPRPRRLNCHIPRDLETVCLKCMEKEPTHRYPTAQAVEMDLLRLLNGEPIHARPVGPLERGWRWCKRNPVISSLVGGLVASILVGFLGVTWQWQRAENTATARKRVADRYKWLAGQETARSENAEKNYRRVRDHILTAMATKDEALRETALADALSITDETYEKFEGLHSKNQDWLAAQGHFRLRFHELVEAGGDPDEVETALRGAREIFQRLTIDHPGILEYHEYLAESCIRFGIFLQNAGREDEAQAMLGAACNVLQRLTIENSGSLAYRHHLAIVQLLTCDESAYRRTCTEAVERFARSDDPAIGRMLVRTCVLDPSGADDWESIVEIAERVAESDALDGKRSQAVLGAALYRAGSFADAVEPLNRSIDIHADDAAYEYLYLSMIRHRLGEDREAHACREKAVLHLECSLPYVPTEAPDPPQSAGGLRPGRDLVGLYRELQLRILLGEATGLVQGLLETAR